MTQESFITWSPPESLGGERPLPVKLRNGDYEVVAEGLTDKPIAVPAGWYWVTATLLDGREVGPGKRVRASAFSTREAAAAPLAAAATPLEAPSAAFGSEIASDAVADDAPAEAKSLASGADQRSLVWTGNWWSLWDDPAAVIAVASGSALSESGPTRLTRDPSTDQMLAIDTGPSRRFAVIPFDMLLGETRGPEPAIDVLVEPTPTGPVARFRSPFCEKANTLLAFIEVGNVANMQPVSAELIASEDEGGEADVSVLRVIASAYVTLRSNGLDGLEWWLERLAQVPVEVPDIACLRAEMHARLGQHDRALDALDRAIAGRAPWFRSGLSYIDDRLRLYVEVSDDTARRFEITPARRAAFVTARDRLGRALNLMETTRHIATFALAPERLKVDAPRRRARG